MMKGPTLRAPGVNGSEGNYGNLDGPYLIYCVYFSIGFSLGTNQILRDLKPITGVLHKGN